jgi:hypothetical protein
MRYDLLLGGKHRHFPTNDFRLEILAALDRETLNEFLKNRKPRSSWITCSRTQRRES